MSLSIPQLSNYDQPLYETVFYGDGLAWVTDKRVVFHNTMYWVSSIKSASVEAFEANRGMIWSHAYNVVFTLLSCVAFVVISVRTSEGDLLRWLAYFFLGLSLLGLVMLVREVRTSLPATVYALRLADAKGSSVAFASLDRVYLESLADLITSSIKNNNAAEDGSVTVRGQRDVEEDVEPYLRDGRNLVSSQVLMLDGREYSLSQVRSATTRSVRHDKWWWLEQVRGLGSLFYLIVLGQSFVSSTSPGDSSLFPFAILAMLVVSVIALTPQGTRQKAYLVVVRLSSGSANAFATLDDKYAFRLAKLIKKAVKANTTSGRKLLPPSK